MMAVSTDRFEKEITVHQFDCDLNSKMKVGAIMRQVQQISTDHCDSIGITEDRYIETHTAFLLAKISVEIYKEIPVREKLKAVSRPFQPVRAVYQRYTSLYNEAGEESASVDARWILTDILNKRILRRAPEELGLSFEQSSDRAHNMDIPRVKDAPKVGTVTVGYSRTDLNRHMNNTEYADVLSDFLPQELMCSKGIRKLVLNYHQEIPMGQTVNIHLREIPGDEEKESGWYGCGMLGEVKAFEAWIQFQE